MVRAWDSLFGIRGAAFLGAATQPYALFVSLLKLSLPACVLVAVVLLARWLLRKAPKWITCALWALVALRLLCPFALESPFSMMPDGMGNGEAVDAWMGSALPGGYPQGEAGYDTAVSSGVLSQTDMCGSADVVTGVGESAMPQTVENRLLPCFFFAWLVGMISMLLYALFSSLRLKRRVAASAPYADKVLLCDEIDAPFLLGVVRPRIYLPSRLSGQQLAHVLAHERAHLKRLDHWWKFLGFLLLAVYWFNPVLWLAYFLLCRDMELACDESVLRDMDTSARADYAQSLLDLSRLRRAIPTCPLAFGARSVRVRVRSALDYKKPVVWVSIAAMLTCAVVALCFLTVPTERAFPMNGRALASFDTDLILSEIRKIERLDEYASLYAPPQQFGLILTSDFEWENNGAIKFYNHRDGKNEKTYSAQLRFLLEDQTFFMTKPEECQRPNYVYRLEDVLDALKYIPQKEVRQLSPDADAYLVNHIVYGTPGRFDRSLTYTPDGVADLHGWQIHLSVQPMRKEDGAYHGVGEETIHLFYRSDLYL